MASSHKSLFIFFLLVIPVFFFSPSNASDEEKVTLSVYYESLCPYCSNFVAQDLLKAFNGGLLPIVNLRLIPWGNAALNPNGSFQCQHGQEECLLNTVEACTIIAYPDVEMHYPLIQCVENLSYQQRESEWQGCFSAVSLDPQPVYECYNNGHGQQIELQYAHETAELNPSHTFVPWIVVDNQPLEADYKNFVQYVCKAYRGNAIPTVCSSSQLGFSTYEKQEIDSNHQGCYVGDPMNISTLASSEKLP